MNRLNYERNFKMNYRIGRIDCWCDDHETEKMDFHFNYHYEFDDNSLYKVEARESSAVNKRAMMICRAIYASETITVALLYALGFLYSI